MINSPLIGIEALGIDEEGGARTSILNLVSAIIRNNNNWNFVIYLSNKEPTLQFNNVKQVILPFRRGIVTRLFMQLYLPLDVFFRKIDLIHFTKSQASLVFFTKMVLTIHDLTILHHPEIHSRSSVLYWKYFQPWMARRMDAIIAVSENAAKDIRDHFRIPSERITVVYNSSQFQDLVTKPFNDSEKILKKYSLTHPYFIYVGLLALKKNLETLIVAMQELIKDGNSLPHLILVGPRYSDSDASYIIELIDDLHLSNHVKYLGKLPKGDLFQVFKNAMMFLFPSLHEGFGIPCLEAMELGVPLIASKVSAIPEVVGEAGILIEDFKSPETWAMEIRNLYNDPERRLKMIDAGYKQYAKISSEHSFSALSEIYQKLIN